jgi:hypothetical protein
MSEDKMRILKNFIEKEIANSDDQFQVTVQEMQEIFKNAIKAIEELSGEEIDVEKFNEFLKYYKIMKIVEKVSEELRCDKYLESCRKGK